MKTTTLFACAAALLSLALFGRAAGPWDDSDHQLFLKIESDPPGAIVRTVTQDGTNGLDVGRTPTVIPINLFWASNLFGKRWHKMRVHSPGQIASATYDTTNKTYDLNVTFALEKEGFITEVVGELVTVLKRSGDEWDDVMDNLPAQRKFVTHLKPAPQASAASATGAAAMRTVIVAAGDGAELGTIEIDDASGRVVQVDGLSAGKAPVRVMTHAGNRTVTVPAASGPPARHEVKVEAGKTVKLELAAPGT